MASNRNNNKNNNSKDSRKTTEEDLWVQGGAAQVEEQDFPFLTGENEAQAGFIEPAPAPGAFNDLAPPMPTPAGLEDPFEGATQDLLGGSTGKFYVKCDSEPASDNHRLDGEPVPNSGTWSL
jgi:hypothetical protein